MLHGLDYAYCHRRERKGDFRRLWIARINAAARLHGVNYSRLIHLLDEKKVELDRKVLADIAVHDPEGFGRLVEMVKA